jgi:hypothetical protein
MRKTEYHGRTNVHKIWNTPQNARPHKFHMKQVPPGRLKNILHHGTKWCSPRQPGARDLCTLVGSWISSAAATFIQLSMFRMIVVPSFHGQVQEGYRVCASFLGMIWRGYAAQPGNSACKCTAFRHIVSSYEKWGVGKSSGPRWQEKGYSWQPGLVFVRLHRLDAIMLHAFIRVEVKQSPLQVLTSPEGSRRLRLRQSAHEGGKVVSPTHRPPLPPGL